MLSDYSGYGSRFQETTIFEAGMGTGGNASATRRKRSLRAPRVSVERRKTLFDKPHNSRIHEYLQTVKIGFAALP